MNKFVYGLLFCSVAATTSASASGLVDATNPQVIRDIIAGFGSAELGKDSKGDPKITGRMDGNSYTVFFMGVKMAIIVMIFNLTRGGQKKAYLLRT